MRQFGVLIALLGVIACDEDNPVRHLDGGIDSPQMIDAPVTPQPVTLTITGYGEPQVGIVVHFQKADSSLIATKMTDASGVVSQVMEAGGFVTAIDPYAQEFGGGTLHELVTFSAVKPGDQLVLGDGAFSLASMTVSLPQQAESTLFRYEIHSTCGSTSFTSNGSGDTPSRSLSFVRCGATTDLLILRYDGVVLYDYMFEPNVAVADQATINLTAKSYTAAANRTYTFTNKPAGLATLTVEQHVASMKGLLATVSAPTTGSSTSVGTLALPTFANAFGITTGRVLSESGTTHRSVDWGPLSTTAYSTDFGARMLADMSGPNYDVAGHKVTWDEVVAGVAADYVETEARGQRTTASQDNRYVTWRLVAPYARGVAAFPTLPADTYDFKWDADDIVNVSLLTIGKVPGGYDTVRAKVFSVEDLGDVAVSATGSAQFATYASQIQSRVVPTTKKTTLQHRIQERR